MRKNLKKILSVTLMISLLLCSAMPASAKNAPNGEVQLSLAQENTDEEDILNPLDHGEEDVLEPLDDKDALEPVDEDEESDEAANEEIEDSDDLNTEEEGEVTEPITKEDKPYLALGANLTEDQKNIVLNLLGINPDELSEYDVIYTTNEEEYQYLGSYISAQQIGKKALSSVLVVKREKGHGINITTKNISYCTIGMYKNALITAGITDADIIVAGPFALSGTAALVGALKAYSVMTGENISEESMDAALNELVLTGDLAENLGDSQKVEELIAYIKQQIIAEELTTEKEIRKAIEEASDEFSITLSEEETTQLVQLMQKISDLDLDLDSIMNQAKALYDRLAGLQDSKGFFTKVGDFFSNLFQSIADFFTGK